jgi:hypothetical protein
MLALGHGNIINMSALGGGFRHPSDAAFGRGYVPNV